MKAKGRRHPRPIGEIVPGILRRARRGAGALDRLRRAWREVVGEETAKRTAVSGFRNGVVTVQTPSATVRHDLTTFRRDAVLEGLRKSLPDLRIRALRCRIGRLP